MGNQVKGEPMRKARSRIVGLLAFSAAVHFTAPAFAAPTLLDFEDLAPFTTVTTQYGPRGVVFQGAFLASDLGGRSGTRSLRSIPPQTEVFEPVPFVITFTSPQARVTLFANSPGMVRNGTLQAFDANGSLIVQDGPKPVAADAFTTRFEVTSPTPAIAKAVLQLQDAAHYAIDDLEFDGEPPAQPPLPPQVVITSPPNGADFDTNAFTIEGTITGEGLLPTAKATIEFGRPPEQTGPPFTTALSVFGTGTVRQFNLPGGFNGAPLGPIKVTVEAENFAGGKGSATSTITNLPPPIRDRATAEGAGLGDFRFGVFAPGCKIAVYQNVAISAPGFGNETFVIRGDILAKWIPERSHLGCPLAEERPRAQFSFAAGNWCFFVSGTNGPCEAPVVEGRVQDFTGGRIHSTTGIGTFYVPIVFVDAIKKRGGEEATGVPMADPTSSVGAMETWLFQRFIVPELPKRLPSTLEIRGASPRLYLERQAGHLLEPSNGQPLETTGTIWEHFPCDGNLGPCTVESTPAQPEPIPNTGEFCFGGTVASTILLGIGPRAWEPVLEREPFLGSLPLAALRPPDPGNFISTPLFGVVTFAKLADVDLTLIHEWCYGEDWIPLNCFSDWIFRIRPYGAHAGARTFPSLYGGTKDNTTVKIEYERYYSDGAIWLGLPTKRDLIFTAGRWVIDCAHDTYKTELHPIFMFSRMRTVTTLTNPFTGIVDPNPFGGTPENPVPATQADIWVNGWYPGDPIEFDVHPPPRPDPDATLVINKPVDAQAASGVTLTFTREPPSAPSRAHLRFTAPSRHNEITWLGEMKWQRGRGYEGQWYLYWKK
jgi:hypothetical protein